MKKYIIKNADGSEQHVMPSVHDTYKSATQTLLRYLIRVADGVNDDCTESPFDYTIMEVDEKDVNERITDFESARQALGRKPNVDFHVMKEKLSKSDLPLESVARLVRGISPRHLEALIALNQLFTIAEAWNKEDEFVPDFSNCNQEKWFPWFRYNTDEAQFVPLCTHHALTTSANISSRLCFKTSERAEQFGKQFIDLFNIFL